MTIPQSMPTQDPALRRAYEACRRMHLRHDPTYYWATRRLPADVRPATHALYAYVRIADQMVDGPRRPPTAAARRSALDAWEAELRRGPAARHPAARALADAASRHDLPLTELERYMRSMRRDCGAVRMESWEELEDYMEGSAGSVGRIMAPLLGVPSRHREDFGRLGLAFQLANFLRDVREDWALDRVYLPGAGEEDLARASASPALRALVAAEVRRARSLFDACEEAIAAAPRSVRPGVQLAVAAYRRVLDRVEAAGWDVLAARPAGVGFSDLPAIARAALP
jgi:phytoene synthase